MVGPEEGRSTKGDKRSQESQTKGKVGLMTSQSTRLNIGLSMTSILLSARSHGTDKRSEYADDKTVAFSGLTIRRLARKGR